MVRAQELCEGRKGGEASVVVRAERGDDDRPTLRVVGGTRKRVRERRALFVGIAGGEELLELVDGEEQARVGGECVERLGQRIVRFRREDGAELLERPLSRPEQPTAPPIAARQRARSQSREETGAKHGRLAAARGADDAEE